MRLPIGFRAGATRAGIKPSGKPDLALLVSGTPCSWAFVGTLNKAAAPCVARGRQLLHSGQGLQAIVVNAGNANCATGEQGIWADARMAELAAAQLQLAPGMVLTASTGVIGQPLPVEKIEAALPQIRLGLEIDPFMEAIMTTDLVPKMAEATLSSGARVVGVCKGSGMIAPNMATMLAYIVSDAAVPQEELRRGWQGVVDKSFNQVTVDTDTSTNDMAVLMTNGAAGPVDLAEFWQAVERVCVELARKLARDGEGATKLLTVKVTGAVSDSEARKAALSVAASPLWKSAVYGNDPNWGRVMMALGKAGVALEPDKVRITLQGIPLYAGKVLEFDRARASQAMQAEEVLVEADLGLGEGQGTAWGCDLTEGYVRINALYTT
ncbi:bifunctional glutamate N-acetyltransferase/amino-acid acetyltransferase ArgJ [Meiothermus taiwanensis]|jgi:glutamate N-acetyltransferase/amino-acid N-acetyltransferase|uniref:Arginine biosynthesis bifunctional protein ArgJ n=1 Tax=Meiothermus taiwanensis WR-220 TaxID=1339250 RepID=A0ABM6WF19_9DEIN|nr:bifunctional glutamate N-acetyltransferase/amino-acid acetyltransferase ArgJ [Meiothermus taiwanensis]AWR85586.1 arginine biosynthesis bifunctional protein ArgJ [Meiothermus taiwanensis WR-220]KIQ53689.1 N-acetylglutamate synthase [Meiothermus taiwanensis]KZK15312.1 N-acetylglutamate synthase [Meiothermus taiwanensis]